MRQRRSGGLHIAATALGALKTKDKTACAPQPHLNGSKRAAQKTMCRQIIRSAATVAGPPALSCLDGRAALLPLLIRHMSENHRHSANGSNRVIAVSSRLILADACFVRRPLAIRVHVDGSPKLRSALCRAAVVLPETMHQSASLTMTDGVLVAAMASSKRNSRRGSRTPDRMAARRMSEGDSII